MRIIKNIAQIIDTLTKVGYTEDRFAMQNELSCTFCNSQLIASNARICGNRPECQTLYCNDQCAQRDWDQHYTQCSTLKLIQSGRGPAKIPETNEEELARLRLEVENARREAARQRAKEEELARLRREVEDARRAGARERARLHKETEDYNAGRHWRQQRNRLRDSSDDE